MGSIVFSLDTETVWGRIALANCRTYMEQYHKTSDVTFRLIDLFEKYEIPATWAFVGLAISPKELLEEFIWSDFQTVYDLNEQKHFKNNLKLIENKVMEYSLLPHLEKLKNSSIAHDIGSHTYSHLFMEWQNPAGREQRFRKDLILFDKIAQLHDLDIVSFIYPRNSVYHESVLKEFGYKIYRSADKDFSNIWLRRLNRVAPIEPFTVTTLHSNSNSLGVLPGSMAFNLISLGFRKHLPLSWLYSKACKGLDRAVKNKEILHIWFHPFNFAYKTEKHFLFLEKLLIKINQYKMEGLLKVKTMREVINSNE